MQTEITYFLNDYENCVVKRVKTENGIQHFIKFKGKTERIGNILTSKVLYETTLENVQISKQDYENY